MPATEIQADWAVQRIKNLSLSRAVVQPSARGAAGRTITSSRRGVRVPAARARDDVGAGRGSSRRAAQGPLGDGRSRRSDGDGRPAPRGRPRADGGGDDRVDPADHVISSMPLLGSSSARWTRPHRRRSRRPQRTSSPRLPHCGPHGARTERGFPDNSIYVHEPSVEGRADPELRLVVGGDGEGRPDLSRARVLRLRGRRDLDDGRRRSRGVRERASWRLGLIDRRTTSRPVTSCGCRRPTRSMTPAMPPAWTTSAEFLESEAVNVHPVGRNGMHRYNNQDHSMLTALLTVENLFGEDYDTWAVNVDAEYHEEQIVRRGEPVPMAPAGRPRAHQRARGGNRPGGHRWQRAGPRLGGGRRRAASCRRPDTPGRPGGGGGAEEDGGGVAWAGPRRPGGRRLRAACPTRSPGCGQRRDRGGVLRTSSAGRGPQVVMREGYQAVRRTGRYAVFARAAPRRGVRAARPPRRAGRDLERDALPQPAVVPRASHRLPPPRPCRDVADGSLAPPGPGRERLRGAAPPPLPAKPDRHPVRLVPRRDCRHAADPRRAGKCGAARRGRVFLARRRHRGRRHRPEPDAARRRRRPASARETLRPADRRRRTPWPPSTPGCRW